MSLTKAIASLAVFAYGLFTMVLYALIAIKKGVYFTKKTEKEALQLQIGMCSNFLQIPTTPPSRSV